MQVKIPMLNFSSNFSNTTIPILTENDSIINAVNIADEINDQDRALHFSQDITNDNDPIVIEYAPGRFQKLYYGNSY
jgi:hypothetical protein